MWVHTALGQHTDQHTRMQALYHIPLLCQHTLSTGKPGSRVTVLRRCLAQCISNTSSCSVAGHAYKSQWSKITIPVPHTVFQSGFESSRPQLGAWKHVKWPITLTFCERRNTVCDRCESALRGHNPALSTLWQLVVWISTHARPHCTAVNRCCCKAIRLPTRCASCCCSSRHCCTAAYACTATCACTARRARSAVD
jgi:hypothetical protein